MQGEAGRLLQIGWIVEQHPLNDRQRKRSVRDQLIVKLSEAKARAFCVAITAEQSHDLPLPCHVADLLRRIRSGAGGFAGGSLAIESAAVHEIFNRLVE